MQRRGAPAVHVCQRRLDLAPGAVIPADRLAPARPAVNADRVEGQRGVFRPELRALELSLEPQARHERIGADLARAQQRVERAGLGLVLNPRLLVVAPHLPEARADARLLDELGGGCTGGGARHGPAR